ncbi:MAG TPA: hypothetical protein VEV61_05285 [Streptosporangiaceae bacterium]|nr:hypothetical protein [Streptosporangiaceae bacterium]
MKRWMAGAVAVLAAVAGLAASGPVSASSNGWYQVLQVNRSGSFSEIAALSKTNIWAVGNLFDKKDNIIRQPFIRHYDGSSWTTVTIPGAPRFESDQVSASAANNVWVVGLNSFTPASSAAYRFDGSRWHRVPVPAQTFLQGVVALGPKNVWAFGSSGTLFPPHGDQGADVFHWNGTKWRGYFLNFLPQSVSASSSRNVWVAGLTFTRPNQRVGAYRWNGSGWHKVAMPHPVPGDGPQVTAFSRANVWIGWDGTLRPHGLHWDGEHWQTLTIPDNVNAVTRNVVRDGKGGYWFGDAAILTGSTWTNEPLPELGASAGLGPIVRIRGTESFLQPATLQNFGSSVSKPTIYRFDL